MIERLVNLPKVYPDFPELKEPQILLDNLIDNIDDLFERFEFEVVVVEGNEGSGKTTLLAQFALRQSSHAISIFMKPTSRYTYNPSNIRSELCNQINWILCKKDIEEDSISESFIHRQTMKLSRLANRNRDYFYFVIDGLYDIPDEDSHVRQTILDMLPMGTPQKYRFVISGKSGDTVSFNSPKIKHKAFPISGFGLEQTEKYLESVKDKMDKDTIRELWRTCKGNPGYLSAIRRLLLSGEIGVAALFNELPTKLPQLFEIEWNKVDSTDEQLLTILAILAHDLRPYSLNDLAVLTNQSPDYLEHLLQHLEFIEIDNHSKSVHFASEPFRKFACNKLSSLEQVVLELIVQKLLGTPDTDEALSYLPGYLERSGRFKELLTYLSPEHFAKMLERSQSLNPIQQKLDMGIMSAQKLEHDNDLMRFSMQKSIMTVLDGAKIWRSEIEALMALNDYDAALNLAQSAILKEQRLELLSVIAKAKREKGVSPEEGLLEQIHQLYEQIDKKALGEHAIDIASDLLSVDPDFAIQIIRHFS